LHALQFSSFQKKLLQKLIGFFQTKVLFHATSVLEEEDIRNIFRNARIINIPVGVEVTLPVNNDSSVEKANFIFLGRIHPIKGLENLIEALAKVEEFMHSDCKLLIAGYGENYYVQSLKDKCIELNISHKVKFLGRVEANEKVNFLEAGKFLVLPSYSENFGAVVAEALAVGTPVIVSNNTPWNIIADNNAGYFIDNSVTSLVSTIRQVYTLSKDQFNIMQMNAQKIVIQHLDIRQNVKHWLAVFK
jgi:glycosyltransferase involved in cell wall biosynthesis